MMKLRAGEFERLVDAVVWPLNAKDVTALVQLALHAGICLVPYGGGTNVSDALAPPATAASRPLVAVHMDKMDQIQEINAMDRVALVEAGIKGRILEEKLNAQGWTCGHEPDSMEWSTLGGWIATKASGMKQSRYGNIEDLVVEVTVITANGEMCSKQSDTEAYSGLWRTSLGVCDLKSQVIGSEGNLGIITSALIRIFELPAKVEYESALFPDFESGFQFMHGVSSLNKGIRPASVRMMDNGQFKLSQAIKKKPSSTMEHITRLVKQLYVTRLKGFDLDRVCVATIRCEGSAEEVQLQIHLIRALILTHKGMKAGGEAARDGYKLTYGIAYFRDAVMNVGVLAESFETFVPWSKLLLMVQSVRERAKREHTALCLVGSVWLSCRITQVYHEGACVYFYMAFSQAGIRGGMDAFLHIESACREEIMATGGSLSHHHGVGKHRSKLLTTAVGYSFVQWQTSVKAAIDPANVFGIGNGPHADSRAC